jgi:hypothetical protein
VLVDFLPEEFIAAVHSDRRWRLIHDMIEALARLTDLIFSERQLRRSDPPLSDNSQLFVVGRVLWGSRLRSNIAPLRSVKRSLAYCRTAKLKPSARPLCSVGITKGNPTWSVEISKCFRLGGIAPVRKDHLFDIDSACYVPSTFAERQMKIGNYR